MCGAGPGRGGLFPRQGSEGLRAARGAAAEGRGAQPIGALVAGANGGGCDMAGAVFGGGRARSEAVLVPVVLCRPCTSRTRRHGARPSCHHRQVKPLLSAPLPRIGVVLRGGAASPSWPLGDL